MSIILVNYNGGDLLKNTLLSLKNCQYQNKEIIIYDNCSSNFDRTVLDIIPETFLIESRENLGFAHGNNAAYKFAKGDLIFLLNNDTQVEENTISELVSKMINNLEIAAISPKIVFYEKFFKIIIFAVDKKTTILNIKLLEEFLDYPKYFVDGNYSYDDDNNIIFDNYISLKLPLSFIFKDVQINRFFNKSVKYSINEKVFNSNILLNTLSKEIESFDVINNVGSQINSNLDCGDIGLGDKDEGQYDGEFYRDLLCGCAILFQRNALDYNELPFNSNFFAYYEDSDFSLRIKKKGYKLLYTSSAKIRHFHSSTFGEKSDFWNFYVKRNSLVFKYLYNSDQKKSKKQIENVLANNNIAFKDIITKKSFNNSLIQIIQDIDNKTYFDSQKIFLKSLVIYNEYWETLGGGEHRSLMFAKYFEKEYDVILVSKNNFDLNILMKNFNIELKSVKKRIYKNNQELLHDTQFFDVFVNSTHNSNLNTLCKKSFYLVSFPEIKLSNDVLSNYIFLSNSKFTSKYINKNWNVTSSVIYPYVPLLNSKFIEKSDDEINILNVGRFFYGHHSKKQIELIDVYKIVASNFPNKKINLHLVGNVNFKNKESYEYFYKCVENTNFDLNIFLHPNSSYQKLIRMYKKSHFYVHLTGLNETDPAKFEHFGISVAEACQFNCLPLVYYQGGSKEIVDEKDFIFTSQSELIDKLNYFIKKIDDKKFINQKMLISQKNAKKFSDPDFIFKPLK